MGKLNLTKLQKLRDWRGNQNQVLHPRQNQRENKIKKSKLACLANYKQAETF